MPLRVSGWTASENQIYENLINEAMFRTRCCIPCIVQSYNSENNTVECQPAVRERIINEDGTIQYVQLPLLINVPVVFPGSANFDIKFPLSKNDECLVFFSDLSIDNFWQKGSVQNPVEVRRHDLSDGMAIPCMMSMPRRKVTPKASIVVDGNGEITFKGKFGSFTGTQIYRSINTHVHEYATATGTSTTSGPK